MSAAPNQNASALSIFLSGSKKTSRSSAWGDQMPRVVVVEPDESARSVLRVALTAEGFEVQLLGSAEEALRLLTTTSRPLPAAVVVEASLPGADGFSLCGQLRAGVRTSQLPILLTARRHEPYFPEMAEGVGADDYLPKPLFARDVAALLRLKLSERTEQGSHQLTTRDLPLPTLLRGLLAGMRSGRIVLPKERGQVAFRQGQVVDARFDGLRGQEALMRILLLTEGQYSVQFGLSLTRSGFAFGLQELVSSIYPRLLRWRELLQRSVPLDAVLQVDFHQLAVALPQLPEGVNGLVRLFDGSRTVREVLLDGSLDEVTALEVVVRLYVMGVVSPRADSENPESKPRRAPAMFEPSGRGDGLEALLIEQEPGDDWYSALEEKLFGDENLAETWTEQPAQLAAPHLIGSPGNTAPVAQVLADSLSDSGARQLDAFRIQTVVEPAASAIPPAQVQAFVRGQPQGQAPSPPFPMTLPGLGANPLEQQFFDDEETQPLPVASAPGPRGVGATAVLALLAVAVPLVAVWLWNRLPREVRPAVAIAAPVAPRPVLKPVGAPEPHAAPVMAPPVVVSVKAVPDQRVEPTLLERGIALYESGHPRAAVSVLAQAVEASPRTAEAWVALGLAKFDSHDRTGAEAAALRALQLNPDNGRAVILLASIYLDRGQRQKARDQLQRYLELEPTGPFAADARQLLGAGGR